jgi:hypothetical protein
MDLWEATMAAEMVALENSFGNTVYGIPVADQMPPKHANVILFIEDADVAIHGCPVVGWNSGTDKDPRWWSGLPGQFINLAERRWTVTHWRPLHADRPDGVKACPPGHCRTPSAPCRGACVQTIQPRDTADVPVPVGVDLPDGAKR